eukprot:2485581-Pyramimonas_sp.AAC.1
MSRRMRRSACTPSSEGTRHSQERKAWASRCPRHQTRKKSSCVTDNDLTWRFSASVLSLLTFPHLPSTHMYALSPLRGRHAPQTT